MNRITLSIFFLLAWQALSAQQDSSATEPVMEDTTVYDYAQIPPKFSSGDAAVYKFFDDNMKYPRVAKKKSIQGMVLISVTVEKDGSLSNFKVIKPLEGGCT